MRDADPLVLSAVYYVRFASRDPSTHPSALLRCRSTLDFPSDVVTRHILSGVALFVASGYSFGRSNFDNI